MATMFRGYRRQQISRNMPHHGLCIGSCGQSHYRNITGCTEAVCPTPCFARTTSRDSGLFCHNRDVRKGSQHRRRKPDEGRHLDLPDDYIGLLDRCAECRRRLTMGPSDRLEPSRHGRRNGDRLPTISIASLYTAECVEPQNCGQCEGD